MNDDNVFGKVITAFVTALISILVIVTLLGGFGRILGREFSKYDEETRRQVVNESKTFQDGTAQNIDRLCLEWERTGNDSVARSIRHRTSGYTGELPDYVQDCVNKARNLK